MGKRRARSTGIGRVTKVRHRVMSGDNNLGYVNSDLIFLAGIPCLLVWEARPFGDYPAVTVSLDGRYLHQLNWPQAQYLYERSIEDPQGAPSKSNTESAGQGVEELSEPMPNDVRQAFLEAIRLYKDWRFGGSEPLVGFRKLRQISISGVCELVLSYRNEPLPENIHKVLRNVIGVARANPLDKDPSFAAGARCLLNMIDVNKQRASTAA